MYLQRLLLYEVVTRCDCAYLRDAVVIIRSQDHTSYLP